ncbi:MAG: NfeD family protein [bacterium]|nr:NfeD family protein [bacterium]
MSRQSSEIYHEKIFSFLSIPRVVSLFLTIGVLGLIFTFKTGEPNIGIVAALVFLIGLWGTGAISISIMGAALLIFGIILLVVEFFTPEFGIFGIIGSLALVAGILLFAEEPFRQPIFLSAITYFVIGIGIGFVVLFSVAARLTAKILKAKPQVGLEALIGKEGLVIDNLAPYGRITVDGQSWRAKCEKFQEKEDVIEAGSSVKIVGFSGNTLLTQKVEEK